MRHSKKDRADILLVEGGHFESRAKAKQAIMAGQVRIGEDHVIRNAAENVPVDAPFIIKERFPYVSRGAMKLKDAFEKYLPDASGLTALDIGASTGGFTDLMLQKGVSKVFAVDVGTGQLHYKLRSDKRVISIEKFNARELSARVVPDPIDILTCDVSFISVKKVLPPANPLLRTDAWAFILIKPQFEAQRNEVGKGGVVRDDTVRQRTADDICEFARSELGWTLIELGDSPIKGPKGNREFMAVFKKGGRP